jgi:hypothetical protein
VLRGFSCPSRKKSAYQRWKELNCVISRIPVSSASCKWHGLNELMFGAIHALADKMRTLARSFLSVVALAISTTGVSPVVLGQDLTIGVVGGISPGRDFQTKAVSPSNVGSDIRSSGSDGYMVGPSIEFRIKSPVSLEVDALYRALHFTDSRGTVVTWQFPVLVKYRFTLGPLKPFIEAGPSFRTAGNLNGTNPSNYGGTAGLGVELHLRTLKIAPTVRYTRWARDGNQLEDRTNSNRVELLVGISRDSESTWQPLGKRFPSQKCN